MSDYIYLTLQETREEGPVVFAKGAWEQTTVVYTLDLGDDIGVLRRKAEKLSDILEIEFVDYTVADNTND